MQPKYRIPKLPQWNVARQRLVQRVSLSYSRGTRMVVVHGPAGFGKTTLLAQLADHEARAGTTPIWVTIDRNDRAPQILLDNIVGGFRHAKVDIPNRSLGVVELCESLPADCRIILLLDELEHVTDSASILVIKELCEELPSRVRMIVATREVPVQHMTKLYIAGAADLVESTEVQFHDDEAVALLGDSVVSTEVDEVLEMAEGWAMILQLARIYASRAPDSQRIVSELRATRAETFQYFLEQIYLNLSEEQSRLLGDCSILSHVDPQSANAISGRDDAHAILRGLVDLQPIISITSEEPIEFRFHPLFKDFLLEVLRRKGAHHTKDLHRRAASYFADKHVLADAVQHAVAADDLSLAADILTAAGGIACVFDVGPAVLKSLLDNFSEEWFVDRPVLGVMSIVQRAVEGDAASAEQLFRRVFGEEASAADTSSALDDEQTVLRDLARVFVLMTDDLRSPLTDDYFSLLTKLSAHAYQRHSDDPRHKLVVLAARVFIDQRYGVVSAASEQLADYKLVCEREGYAPKLPTVTPQLGLMAFGRGDFDSALTYLMDENRDAARMFGEREQLLQQVASAVIAKIHYERDELKLAQRFLLPPEEAIPLVFPEILSGSMISRAYCWFAQGRAGRALRFLDVSMEQAKARSFDLLFVSLLAVKLECLLRLDRRSLAVAEAEANGFEAAAEALLASRHWPWIFADQIVRAFVLVLVEKGRGDDALRAALRFIDRAEHQGRRYMMALGFVLQALAESAQGDSKAACTALEHALDETSRMNVIRPFLDLDAILLPEFSQCAAQAHSAAVQSHLQAILSSIVRALKHCDEISGLTRRETDILCELAQGDGRKQIARRLAISPETVKHHTKGLYTKLRASNAREALINAWHVAHSRADDLGGYPPSSF